MTDALQLEYIPNGVDGTTGDYLMPPMRADELFQAIQVSSLGPAERELTVRKDRAREKVLSARQGVDPRDLAQTGWGVIASTSSDPRVVEALRPLLDHRRAQAGRRSETRYREFLGADGYQAGETKQEFLRRHGSGPGPVDPDVIPYYLLIVGNPEEIPFSFQYQLGVQHAVGRLAFDEPASCRRYAESVIAAERVSAVTVQPARLTFFGTRHPGDRATESSAAQLVDPLASAFDQRDGIEVSRLVEATATKAALTQVLHGPSRPDLLFTATHGMAFPSGHERQRNAQGALLCQDWPGPERRQIRDDEYFGADDVRKLADADLTGMMAFLFACFSAGTPTTDSFHRGSGRPKAISPEQFVAALPSALLGREGGALAVVGHVDRSWGYSFVWPGVGSQVEAFRSAIAQLTAGHPLGSSLEYLSDRYAELAVDLGAAVDDTRLGRRADEAEIARLWTATADARSFLVLGDPAARLRADTATAAQAAPGMSLIRPRGTNTDVSERPSHDHVTATTVEVVTYLTTDPSRVSIDADTSRITGAQLHILTRIRSDGVTTQVFNGSGSGQEDPPESLMNALPKVMDEHKALLTGNAAEQLGSDPEGAGHSSSDHSYMSDGPEAAGDD